MLPKKLFFSILIVSIFQSVLYTSDTSTRTTHICLPHLLFLSHPHQTHYQKFHHQHNGYNPQPENTSFQKKSDQLTLYECQYPSLRQQTNQSYNTHNACRGYRSTLLQKNVSQSTFNQRFPE